MAKMVRKGDLPQKTCQHCARPFAWRKKWERVWNEVKYCSERCRREAKASSASELDGRLYVGLAEVVADKKQWTVVSPGNCVGEAVAEVQIGSVTVSSPF